MTISLLPPFRLAVLALLLLCAQGYAAEVLLGDNTQVRGTLAAAAGKFTLQDDKGARDVSAPALALYGGAPLSAEPAESICLGDGSVVAGEIAVGKTPAEFNVRRGGGESLVVKAADVIAFELNPLDKGISPERELAVPGMIMTNGKVMVCTYEWISAIEVGIKTDAGRLRLSRKSIHRVVLTPGAQPMPNLGEGRVLALTTAGEAVYGELLALGAEGVRIGSIAGELSFPQPSLYALVFGGAATKSLMSLKPTKIVTKPYLDYICAPAFGRRYSGDLLRVRGIVFPAGILLHSRTEITYALDGASKLFAALIGLDAALSNSGTAVFEVWCDGKKAATQAMASRQEPALLSVNADKVKELTLILDYGSGGSIGDHGVWGVPVLCGK